MSETETMTYLSLGVASMAVELPGMQQGAALKPIFTRAFEYKGWAQSAKDMVWRRSKCGRRLTQDQISHLAITLMHLKNSAKRLYDATEGRLRNGMKGQWPWHRCQC